MNRVSILSLVVLLVTPIAIAQSVTLNRSDTIGAECPLDIQASHGATVPIGMNAGPTTDGRALERQAPAVTLHQQIHLTLINLRTHDIVSTQITVHGFSDKWKAIDLAKPSQGPDLAKTLEVVLDVKGMARASSDLSLSRFTAVTSVDLNSITYADGTTWHTSSPAACSITPDLIMLVAAR